MRRIRVFLDASLGVLAFDEPRWRHDVHLLEFGVRRHVSASAARVHEVRDACVPRWHHLGSHGQGEVDVAALLGGFDGSREKEVDALEQRLKVLLREDGILGGVGRRSRLEALLEPLESFKSICLVGESGANTAM